ncbi:MAG: hypothetical protein V4558_16985 [Gemmatimonadota bacterium]
MLARAARLVLRIAGWLLTPIVLAITAAIGATIGAMAAPRFSPTGGLLVTAVAGLLGALLGLLAWEKLLGRSPELRAALALTAEGIPEPAVVEEMVTAQPDPPDPGAP